MKKFSNEQQPTAIDLFSGSGGLTCGIKQAGFKVIGAVELDDTASQSYLLNHPEVHLWQQDITTLTSDEIMKTLNLKSGELDLLAGCPPCQGFSYMRTKNRRQPVDDPRNNLIKQFYRLVEDLNPKTVMLENVPGLNDDNRSHQTILSICLNMTIQKIIMMKKSKILILPLMKRDMPLKILMVMK